MKLWLGICAVLLFGAGVTTGLLVRAVALPGSSTPAPAVDAAPAPGVASIFDANPDYPLYLVTSQEVYDELGLRPAQKQELEDLFAANLARLQQLRSQLGALGVELRKGIVGVLEEEQQGAFARIQQRYADEKIRCLVNSRMDDLRREVRISVDQEPYLYGVLFDCYSKKKDLWTRNQKQCSDQEELRRQFAEIRQERDRLIEEQLRSEQIEAFRAFRERDRHWRARAGTERAATDATSAGAPKT